MNEHRLAGTIIGDAASIRRVRALIASVAPTGLSVLVTGPTGSGKELVAHGVHQLSGRTGQFVSFNVCAIADSMFEDSMFGHVKGAFTGAVRETPGLLGEANGGTAFFDEIGGLPIAAQAKLLRVLETKEFRPIGAARDRRSDFRVVAATNDDLVALVRSNRFREDLLERLSGFVIKVPPLADRVEDIPALVAHYLARAHPEVTRARFSPGALLALQELPWRRNIRELYNVLGRLLIVCANRLVDRDDVFAITLADEPTVTSTLDEPKERRQLVGILIEVGWDTEAAAEVLGVNRVTVYRWMKRLGIPTPRRGGLLCHREQLPARC